MTTSPDSPRFFLSYRKVDANRVRQVAHWLRASGYEAWLDEDSIPLDLPDGSPLEGEHWQQHVAAGIADSTCVLLFSNVAWLESDACVWEFEQAKIARSQKNRLVLQICIPDERHTFTRCVELQSWSATHVWSSCDAFAEFLAGQTGAMLTVSQSPDLLEAWTDDWKSAINSLTVVSIPPEHHARRQFVSSNESWQSVATEFEYFDEDGSQLLLKVAENPFRTLLAERVPDLEGRHSELPRDESIQLGYREIARSFFEQRTGAQWRGTHQIWHENRCCFAISYFYPAGHSLGAPDRDVLERLVSMQWLDDQKQIVGEVTLTFRKEVDATADSTRSAARFAMMADAVVHHVRIPQEWPPGAFVDLQLLALHGGFAVMSLVGALVGLWLDPNFTPLLSAVAGWEAFVCAAIQFELFPSYLRSVREEVFLHGSHWSGYFALIWPLLAVIVTATFWPAIQQHYWLCTLGGFVLASNYCRFLDSYRQFLDSRASRSRIFVRD